MALAGHRCRSVLGESPALDIGPALSDARVGGYRVCPRALDAALTCWVLALVVGGICYTIGAVFYTCTKKKKYMHSVFHLWVLAGSIFQFFSIYLFVLA